MSSKAVFLDVDSSICEKNYLIAKDPQEDEFSKLFGNSGIGDLPPKMVKPSAGFCIKTHQVNSDKKVFVNICQTDAIPPPKDITESELIALWSTDDITDYRIPMSIGDIREVLDKKEQSSTLCDIAIHPKFFSTVESSEAFKNFFLAVAFEGLNSKHGIETADEKIILKNKKVMGTLQVHRIQQREINEKMGLPEKLPTVSEMLKKDEKERPKIIEVLSDRTSNCPEYRLFRKPNEEHFLYAEVYLPYVISSKDISLDIGEDRIVLESMKGNYFLDTFHPYSVDQDNVTCLFNKDTKFLTLTMPIKTC